MEDMIHDLGQEGFGMFMQIFMMIYKQIQRSHCMWDAEVSLDYQLC